jgi:hypothetical protein
MQGVRLGATAGRRFLAAMFVQVPCSPLPHGARLFSIYAVPDSRSSYPSLHVTTFGCHHYLSVICVR